MSGSVPSHVMKMAETAVWFIVFVFVFVFQPLHGAFSSDFKQQLLHRVLAGHTNKTEVLVDFILFRNFRKQNDMVSIDNELDFSKVDKTEQKFKHPIDVEEQMVIHLMDEDHPQGKYNVITRHSETQTSGYQDSINKMEDERDKYESKVIGMLFRDQSIEGNTISHGNKLKNSMLDKMVDFLLQILRDGLHETGRDQIAIPDVDEQFSLDIVFIPIKGRFKAEDGWFRNLSTIYRTGEVEVTTSRLEITVEFDLGLKITEFGYRKYNAQFGALEGTGSLTGSIASDSIATKISLAYVNRTCRAHLESLKVTSLNGIYVTLSGWDGFGWLMTFIANCISDSYRNQIIHAVEEALSRTLEERLEKFTCGQLFPLT